MNLSDVILCLRMAIGLDVQIQEQTYQHPYLSWLVEIADMNDDGDVDISDVILILQAAQQSSARKNEE